MITNVSILLIACLCIAYAGLNLYAFFAANPRIFPAPPASYRDDPSIFKLASEHGEELSAYYLEAPNSPKLLLYSHGNGEDIGSVRPILESFQKQGISVLAYEYPGYGTSTGSPSENGTYAAIKAAYTHATGQLGYQPEQITLYGRSLGSGPSTWLAEQEPVAGLILDGAFSSTFRVMTEIKLLLWDRFDNYARLPHIQCPVLVIHGTHDLTVPVRHAYKNWSVIPTTKHKLIVEGAGHSDLIEKSGPQYWDTVYAFIQGKDIQ